MIRLIFPYKLDSDSHSYLNDIVIDATVLAEAVDRGEDMETIINNHYRCQCGMCEPIQRELYVELCELLALKMLSEKQPTQQEWDTYLADMEIALGNPVIRRFYEQPTVEPVLAYLVSLAEIAIEAMDDLDMNPITYWDRFAYFRIQSDALHEIVLELTETFYQDLAVNKEDQERYHDIIFNYITEG